MSGNVYKTDLDEIQLPGGPGAKPAPAFLMAAMRRCLSIMRSLPPPRRDNVLQCTRLLLTNVMAASIEWQDGERDATLEQLFVCVRSDLRKWDTMLDNVAPR